jgi:pimeloyl-ACP methyl ester carboxylesterase
MSTGPTLEAMLPPGIRSRMLSGVNGLDMHILEGGHETPGRPLALLVHGFPELAFSWRHVMPALVEAGYHVVAPDQRGFGRTTGGATHYDCDLIEFSFLSKVRDMMALVEAVGQAQAAIVVGHDLGSPVAAWCGLVRPDLFRSVVMMSAPHPGVAPIGSPTLPVMLESLSDELAALPNPRKYYLLYNIEREAAADYDDPPQGLHDFFRAYFHYKSADWAGNRPFRLAGRTAEEMAKMPTYYVMELGKGMARTVADFMPSPAEIAACRWLNDDEVALFAREYGRTGMQGPLNATYRPLSDPRVVAEMTSFAGRAIDVPSTFISGAQDWGNYQTVGAIEAMRTRGCSRMTGVHFVEGAGHWVQQEQPAKVTALILDFLRETKAER